MKKSISVIIAAVMALCMIIPAFAVETSRFGVNVVSENDKTAIVSIDYNGGTAFNCLDFDVKLSNRVSITDCANGAGLRNFKIYVGDLGTQDATISSFNKDSNPVKFTFATTVGFKATNGKDLLVLTLKKSSADKLTSNDVKLTVTNCGISGTKAGDVKTIGTTVTQIGDKVSDNQTIPGQAGTTATVKTTAVSTTAETTQTGSSDKTTENKTTEVSENGSTVEKKNAENDGKSVDRNKIIIIGALAISMIAVIAAGVVYIAKKAKKEDNE